MLRLEHKASFGRATSAESDARHTLPMLITATHQSKEQEQGREDQGSECIGHHRGRPLLRLAEQMLPKEDTPKIFYFFIFCLLGSHPGHMDVPGLGVKLELQLPAYTTATTMLDLSRVCDLHHSLWQCSILTPLSWDRDQTCILMDTQWYFVTTEPQWELLKLFKKSFSFLICELLWPLQQSYGLGRDADICV